VKKSKSELLSLSDHNTSIHKAKEEGRLSVIKSLFDSGMSLEKISKYTSYTQAELKKMLEIDEKGV
jgi:hypothetical protein